MSATLSALPGLEVHHVDPPTGRLIITQEALTVEDEVAGLQRIQTLPGVILAELVLHHLADEPQNEPGLPPEVPARLKN